MAHVTGRLTVNDRDQPRNPTLDNRAWATFTFIPPHRGVLSDTVIRPSVCLSLGYSTLAAWRSCLGFRHAGCLQLIGTRDVRTADSSADGRRSAASRTAIGGGGGGHIYTDALCCRVMKVRRHVHRKPCNTKQISHIRSSKHPRSTQPCIPPGSLNRVPDSAGVRARMSPIRGAGNTV